MTLLNAAFLALCGTVGGDHPALDRVLVPPTPSATPRAGSPEAKKAPPNPSGPVASIGVSSDAKVVAASFLDGEAWVWKDDAPPFNAEVSNDRYDVPLVTVSESGIVWIVKRSNVYCLQHKGDRWLKLKSRLDINGGDGPTALFASPLGDVCCVSYRRIGGYAIGGRDDWNHGLARLRLEHDGKVKAMRLSSTDAFGGRVMADGTLFVITQEINTAGRGFRGISTFGPDGAGHRLAHGPFDGLLAVDKTFDGMVAAISVQEAVPDRSKAWVGLVYDDGHFLPTGQRSGPARRAVAAPGPDHGSFVVGFEDGVFIVVDKEGQWRGGETKAHAAPITATACAHKGRVIATGAEDGSLKIWKLR